MKDTATGKELSLAEATAEGVVDTEKGKFVDRNTGEMMSLSDAIDRGDVIVASCFYVH